MDRRAPRGAARAGQPDRASGSAADPIGKYGVGSLAAAMLDEGAGSRDSLELADALEFLGANLSTTSSFDYSAIRLSVPVSKLGDALPLMSDVALRPTFPATELDRLKKERLTGLLQARDNPAALIRFAFPRVIFGPTHRYGTAANGLPAAIEAFTVPDLQAFYRAHYRPDNSTLLIVGDITPASVMPMLEKAFGIVEGRGHGGARRGSAESAAAQVAADLHRRQARMRRSRRFASAGWACRARRPITSSLEVLNTVLGGSFTSRLNQNLREEHGYSYGASSSSTCGCRQDRSSPPPACRPTRPANR